MKSILLSKKPANLTAVFSDATLQELEERAKLCREPFTREDILSDPERFSDTEYIFSTWGMPSFSEDESLMLGDVVLSLERAHEQAKEIGNTFLEEVAFLTIHSTLHLLGYDHERSTEEDEEQCRIQRAVASALEI